MTTPVREITVGGITFRVRLPWKLVRQYLAELAAAEQTSAGEYQRQRAVEEAARRFLAAAVVGWQGVVDRGGRPVDFRPELLDELDVAVVAALLEKIAEPPEELRPKKGANG